MPPSRFIYRFGPFEWDPDARQLLENCNPLHTADQSLRLLEVLLARAGRLVTRQQLQAELWPDGTYVNFERSINSAMRRLRRALGDDNENPRYIATVTGHGYRFIAPVERVEVHPDIPASAAPATVGAPTASTRWLRHQRWALAGIVVVAALVFSVLWPRWLEPQPRLVSMRALTTDGGMDLPARPASDGTLLYYFDRAGGHWNLMSNRGNAATARVVAAPFVNTRLFDISADHTEWLLGNLPERGAPAKLWRETPGDAPVRLGSLVAFDALWGPGGTHVYYSFDNGLWRAQADGSQAQQLASLPGDPDWLSWSPDGRRLSFTLTDATGKQSLWLWTAKQGARKLPAADARCCGAWTADGRYFLYSVQQDHVWNLWAQRETNGWSAWIWPQAPPPVQLTFEPHDSWGAFTRFGRDQVVFYQSDLREEAQTYNRATQRMQPLLPGRAAIQITYSPDGRHLAYLDDRDNTIWTAELAPDGRATNFRQLTDASAVASFPNWSPDSQWIAYSSQSGTKPWRVYRVAAAGGPSTPLVQPTELSHSDIESVDWSPDGARQVVTLELHHPDGPEGYAIGIIAHGHIAVQAGSQNLASVSWSPDGRWLAAFTSDQRQLEIYDFSRRRWQVVASGHVFTAPQWSRDSLYVYFQDLLAPGQPVYRIRAGSWQQALVADFSTELRGGIHRCGFGELTPDGNLIVSLNRGSADLYVATVALP